MVTVKQMLRELKVKPWYKTYQVATVHIWKLVIF